MNRKTGKEVVIIVHGIWVGTWVMRKLATRLRDAGYEVVLFSQKTVKDSPVRNGERLFDLVKSLDADQVHYIAHSLGGVALMNFLTRHHDELPPGRAILIGSPVAGSMKARRLYQLPFGPDMFGKATEGGLFYGGFSCPENIQVGSLAGTVPMGLGLFLGPFGSPNDGTVAVNETRIGGLTDHICMKTSHTGMLVNSKVAEQLVFFLQHGQFNHDSAQSS